uniref:hypothetical protein n=1 Tax=Nocardia cyriacigeorgica TaxID=135487 RepID=UPI00245469A1
GGAPACFRGGFRPAAGRPRARRAVGWMLLSPGMAPAAEIATGVRGTNSALAVDGVNTVP